jgi:hypothetical protein
VNIKFEFICKRGGSSTGKCGFINDSYEAGMLLLCCLDSFCCSIPVTPIQMMRISLIDCWLAALWPGETR